MNDHDDRHYRGFRDILTGQIILAYSVNGTDDTLHVSARVTDETEAKKFLALLVPATTAFSAKEVAPR